MNEPYHRGEIAVQEAVGEREAALLNGRMMEAAIPAPARPFVSQQSCVVLGWVDARGQPWATMVAGAPGFTRCDADGLELIIDLADPLHCLSKTPPFQAMQAGDWIGALFIELTTRRRLRVNGRVAGVDHQQLLVSVERGYGLCPKYIQRRKVSLGGPETAGIEIRRGTRLDEHHLRLIEGADTCFVASCHPDGPTDVSHRGGRPGFVRLRDRRLHIPEYVGNSMFNTLGNFHLYPHAGMLFIDFETNELLQLTGDVDLTLKGEDSEGETGGTGRWWDFSVTGWFSTSLNVPLAWEFIDSSPFNP